MLAPVANVVDTDYTVVAKVAKAYLPGFDAYQGMHARMRAIESPEHVGKPGFGEIGWQAEAHLTLRRRAPDGDQRFVVEVEDAARISEQDFTGRRRRQATALFREQRLSDLVLDLADLLADRRLRSPDSFRSAAETAQLFGQHQRPEHVHVEIGQLHTSE